ncbi:hypothetical protein ACHAWX_001236 [Stephanocyclus meneghinianus]
MAFIIQISAHSRHVFLLSAVILSFTQFISFLHLSSTDFYLDSSQNQFILQSSIEKRRLDTTIVDRPPLPWYHDVPSLLSRAESPAHSSSAAPFRLLLITTSLSEYDKGTRGTQRGYDRLRNVLLPPLVDAVDSMHSRGWHVDVYLVLGYGPLSHERRRMIEEALPSDVGLEIWDDAIPLFYANSYNKRPKKDQSLTAADHALSRQHRFVLRDKLNHYDFFVCFEDDMRIRAEHVSNFLQLSAQIRDLYDQASSSHDGMVHVSPHLRGNSTSSPRARHKSNDKASVGNDVVHDPIRADQIQRLFPGLLRVEVLDRHPNHPLRVEGVLDNHRFAKEVPPSPLAFSSNGTSVLNPMKCCQEEEPPRGKMTSHPNIEEVVLWETNIQATGVRRYPDPIGWVAAMPVEDRADVGSWWSGYPDIYGEADMKRPRRVDETIGNQAGFMATRSQIEYFHNEACPGGFLPPFDSNHWRGDSLQRHSVEFWSGGFQLFGQVCIFVQVVTNLRIDLMKSIHYNVLLLRTTITSVS